MTGEDMRMRWILLLEDRCPWEIPGSRPVRVENTSDWLEDQHQRNGEHLIRTAIITRGTQKDPLRSANLNPTCHLRHSHLTCRAASPRQHPYHVQSYNMGDESYHGRCVVHSSCGVTPLGQLSQNPFSQHFKPSSHTPRHTIPLSAPTISLGSGNRHERTRAR
ncbi:hypothetical protein VOLCADRAFT_91425 [Volvox carteri f. nagariensis]|uniref:Uncharacterized protein n=1 Tax=Volvox carteri f. nagariensis TaxID=3068 RepID=D8TX18_VOLCA|nr:uncharacterized protein VOLCADRAFT_91425 [Volvox carteri f. nagariensis]EFJ47931.1 hypothetical protein VOLCADRAFT_91425 [Volvox carteri f. nagariensis]|eukprot:XP_002951037.1 hypothetical protein VOLCADRAFT_91425 [Volvox carteri f. nagariensis]